MEDVGLGDRYRYVTIGMRRTVIFEVERGPIEVQGLLRRGSVIFFRSSELENTIGTSQTF